ncbi:MAG: hypothetical protein K6G09_08545 [Treponema sp.]|nr:hypothetical protein [Treponema sp.]
MIENFSYKEFFKDYSIFLGIIVVIMGILIYSVFLSRKSWENHLKTSVEKVLDDYESNQWTVLSNKRINNPHSMSAACYEARSRKTGDIYDAVIIRVETFYGPVAAVYLCDAENNVTFVGFSTLHGRIEKILRSNSYDRRIGYWGKKIPYILGRQSDLKKEGSGK